jgi:hypothetical protein
MNVRRSAAIFLLAVTSLGTGVLAGWAADRSHPPDPKSVAGQPSEPAVTPGPEGSSTPLRGVKSAPIRTPAPKTSRVSGGWPDAASTGVPPGTRLTRRALVRVTRNGAVLNGLDVNGEIEVAADNVTIRNTRVVNPRGRWGIIQTKGHGGLTIEDSEIHGDGVRQMEFGIMNQGGMLTVRRIDVSVISNGIQTNHGLIEESFFHDPKHFSGDHIDMIISTGAPAPGQSLVIRHNTVLNSLKLTCAIGLFQTFGVVHDVLVTDNLISGGSYALCAGSGSRGSAYNVRIIENVFSRVPFRTGGYYGPVAAWDSSGRGNEWRDNVWEGSGTRVTP